MDKPRIMRGDTVVLEPPKTKGKKYRFKIMVEAEEIK